MRLSIDMMKFTVNHPDEMKMILIPFSVGFMGFVGTVGVEITSIYYFCTFGNALNTMV